MRCGASDNMAHHIGTVPSLPADEGFVRFYKCTLSSKRAGGGVIPHRLANAVADKPAGFEVDPENARELICAEALLRRAHNVHRLEPDMQRDMARFKDGSDLDGERLATSVALVDANAGALAPQQSRAIKDAAMRAYPTVRPNLRFDVGVSGALIAETGFVENGSRHRLSPCQRIYNA
jgi:hypothetical protein